MVGVKGNFALKFAKTAWRGLSLCKFCRFIFGIRSSHLDVSHTHAIACNREPPSAAPSFMHRVKLNLPKKVLRISSSKLSYLKEISTAY